MTKEARFFDVELLYNNFPEESFWDLFETYRKWERALEKAQGLADSGYGVRIVDSNGEVLYETNGGN